MVLPNRAVSMSLGFLTTLCLVSTVVRAERPVAYDLLPDSTLAMIRIANVPELRERFRETAMGRIGGDEKVKPLVSSLYGSLVEAYQRIEERVGVPLDTLLSIPQGEVCVAIVAPEGGEGGGSISSHCPAVRDLRHPSRDERPSLRSSVGTLRGERRRETGWCPGSRRRPRPARIGRV